METQYLSVRQLREFGACSEGVCLWESRYLTNSVSSNEFAYDVSHDARIGDGYRLYRSWIENAFPNFYYAVSEELQRNHWRYDRMIDVPRRFMTGAEKEKARIEQRIELLEHQRDQLDNAIQALKNAAFACMA